MDRGSLQRHVHGACGQVDVAHDGAADEDVLDGALEGSVSAIRTYCICDALNVGTLSARRIDGTHEDKSDVVR